MAIAYSLKDNTGGKSVEHLCYTDSWFWAPATCPGCQTPMDHTESFSKVMASVADLHIIRFDQAWAKDGLCGAPLYNRRESMWQAIQ